MGLTNTLTPSRSNGFRNMYDKIMNDSCKLWLFVSHMTTKEAEMVQLDEMEDPELDLSIVELGLVTRCPI